MAAGGVGGQGRGQGGVGGQGRGQGGVGGQGRESSLDVRVIGPDERDTRTAQTPGLQRFAAVSADLTGSSDMWMGYAVLEPGGKTGVHHHGRSETAIYIVSGVTRWWVGEELDDVREAHAGDFVFIPPGIVHWEQNASDTEPVEMVVARSTQEAIVVAVEGHPHRPEHAS